MNKGNAKNSIDIFRIIMAILVIANHTSPLAEINAYADFLLTRIIARLAVPFFFMITGYYILSEKEEAQIQRKRRINRWLINTMKLYLIAAVLYIPVNIYAGKIEMNIPWLIKNILFNGTFYHLWYFPAVIIGVILTEYLIKKLDIKNRYYVCLFLYLIGLFGDSYYGITSLSESLSSFYNFMFRCFDYTRNGLFFAPLYLMIGSLMEKYIDRFSKQAASGFILSIGSMVIEGSLLNMMNIPRHDSMYISLIPASFFLFLMVLRYPGISSRELRQFSMILYIIHPLMILFARLFIKINLDIFMGNNLVLFIMTVLFSCTLSYLIMRIKKPKKKPELYDKSRVWIELDEAALIHNIEQFRKTLKDTEIMAVIKDEAYGHDSVLIAKMLMDMKIKYYAVSCIQEAVKLRNNGIDQDILILGMTQENDFENLVYYDLIQSVTDYEYANKLNQYKAGIRVHIAIDTGMHRLGINWEDKEQLIQVYSMNDLIIEGIYSHLACSDSQKEEDKNFTLLQKERFDKTVAFVKKQGFNTGLVHLQSTYGVLNYPDWHYDLARIGIGLSGLLSERKEVKVPLSLKPVMKVYSRVVSVKEVKANEGIGYGRAAVFSEDRKIAVIAIGYGDGLSKESYGLTVMINNQKAAVIGRVCMDMCMVDVTGLEVQQNDIVLVLQSDSIYKQAEAQNTITNELLIRLNHRIPRIIKS